MAEHTEKTTFADKAQNKFVKWGIFLLAGIVIFLLGLVPMWLQKRQVSRDLETTQKQLHRAEIKNLLLTAIVEAKNGEYEPARQAASEFFTSLNTEIEKGDAGILTADQRAKLKPIFDNRDSTITMLSQRDQASVERLTDLYGIYKQAMGEPAAPTSTSAPTQ